jgi:hypothetical protein
MSIPLIPDELPFSAEEVRSALRRWLPERDADEAADAIIESAASYVEGCLVRSGEFYVAADLLEWWEANRGGYESFPLFDEWRARPRTRREVSFIRLMRDRYDEIFPHQP